MVPACGVCDDSFAVKDVSGKLAMNIVDSLPFSARVLVRGVCKEGFAVKDVSSKLAVIEYY